MQKAQEETKQKALSLTQAAQGEVRPPCVLQHSKHAPLSSAHAMLTPLTSLPGR